MSAIAYCNFLQADDTGDGLSWANAKKVLASASLVADVNGEIRVAGLSWTNPCDPDALAPATWTNGSTTVTFTGTTNPSLATGDFIYPSDAVDAVPFQVATVTNKVIVLRQAWQGVTGSYETKQIEVTTLAAAQNMTGGHAGQKITFGWDPADGTQKTGWWTAVTGTITIDQTDTHLVADKFMGVLGYTDGSRLILPKNSMRISGVLRAHCGTRSVIMVSVSTNIIVEVEEIRSSFSGASGEATVYVASAGNYVRIGRAVVWNSQQTLYLAAASQIDICELIERACIRCPYVSAGRVEIGRYDSGSGSGSTQMPATVTSKAAALVIGNLVDSNSTPLTFSGAGVVVHGPITKRQNIGPDDTVTDVAGPTAVGGYGWKLVPVSTAPVGGLPAQGRRPAYSKIERRPLASGKTATLKFYAAYTGTAADVPECWVELAEPGGLTVQRYTFTPVYSAEAALQDIWDDAIADGLHSIAFGGTASADQEFGFRICCIDNAAGDSVLYCSPPTWTVA